MLVFEAGWVLEVLTVLGFVVVFCWREFDTIFVRLDRSFRGWLFGLVVEAACDCKEIFLVLASSRGFAAVICLASCDGVIWISV